jgi:hypothetical protein
MTENEQHTESGNIVYKYRVWENERHRRILTNNEIFFTSPRAFNDPFDCNIAYRLDLLSDSEIIRRYEHYLGIFYPDWDIEKVRNKARNWAEKGLLRNPENINRNRIWSKKYVENGYGIFSLAGNKDNILLWSHYADSHKGFCLGFRIDKLDAFRENQFYKDGSLIDCGWIEYTRLYPEIVPSSEDDIEDIKRLFLVKSIDWDYEEEYRLILTNGTDKAYRIDDEIIHDVTIGTNMPDDHIEKIIDALSAHVPKPKLFRATARDYEFGLDFEPIDY